jgi:hypothetical protein
VDCDVTAGNSTKAKIQAFLELAAEQKGAGRRRPSDFCLLSGALCALSTLSSLLPPVV